MRVTSVICGQYTATESCALGDSGRSGDQSNYQRFGIIVGV
jgi:hypothetical protein